MPCDELMPLKEVETFKALPLHNPGYNLDLPWIRTRAGLSEIRFALIDTFMVSPGGKIKSKLAKNVGDHEGIEISSERPKVELRSKVDEKLFRLESIAGPREFTYMMISALVNSLQLKLINRSTSPFLLRFTLKEGFDIVTAEIEVPVGEFIQRLEIPLSSFKISRSAKPLLHGQFEVAAYTEDQSPIHFELIDSLILKKDPRHPTTLRIIQKIFYTYAKDLGMHRSQSDSLVRKMIRQLFDPDVQRKALEIVNNPEYFSYFLAQYDLQLKWLENEVPPVFKKVNDRPTARFFGASATVRQGYLPIETGSFAEEHGKFSHAYQLACLLFGMSREESKAILIFFNQLATSGGAPEAWAIWDTLFDGNGNTIPSEPRYWRDLDRTRIFAPLPNVNY